MSIHFLIILQTYHMLTQLIYLLLSIHDTVTTKFWVSEENLPQVLLKSVTELPLLVYGRSGLLQKDINNPTKEDLWESLASPISSVYFDLANMDLYKERIKRSEGQRDNEISLSPARKVLARTKYSRRRSAVIS